MQRRQEIKDKLLAFYAKITKIQRMNKFRRQSFRSRTNYLKYYWEVLKGDLSRALMVDKKNP
jgi:hypothetical protein